MSKRDWAGIALICYAGVFLSIARWYYLHRQWREGKVGSVDGEQRFYNFVAGCVALVMLACVVWLVLG